MTRSYGKSACAIPDCGFGHLAKGYCGKHYQRWRKFGDPLRVDPPSRLGARKWTLNESFFDEVTTERQAYWLGFITADGWIVRSRGRSSLRVELARKDVGHLSLLCADVGSDQAPSETGKGTFIACLNSWKMLDALALLGVGPRKSAIVEPWDGPPGLMPHYWRGMFDGDGAIYRVPDRSEWVMNQCGSRACIDGFASWARGVCGTRAAACERRGGCWQFSVAGGRMPQLLASALYGSASVALERKLRLARDLLDTDFRSLKAVADERRSAGMRRAWSEGRFARAGR